MDKIAQDVGEIQTRLLDHRPVVSAEIRYFVTEFEEKRGHREGRLLENLSKNVLETNEHMQPTHFEDVNRKLAIITKTLEAANHMADRVQQRELESQQSAQLQANMECLKDEWAEFLKKQQRLKEEVDEEYAEAAEQLRTKYTESEHDLTKFKPL
ncbi:biogenesis of lysosome-related organelles complex 1 subunit 5 [Brachionichthys hirsutus]|uniref:biogenesis of lysosome-related organelles complex 1 subunit 5 n=1 Tax=Brachionichthys hirsutus TaxID=412623 RepID=UPI0036052F27